MTRIYTRTGDAGETGLFGGQRVSKDDLRVRAYGTVDEANAVLGVARAAGLGPEIDAVLERLQHHLFDLLPARTGECFCRAADREPAFF